MQRRNWLKGVAAAMVLTGLAVAPTIASAASEIIPPDKITLNNDTSDEDHATGEGACAVAGLDPEASYWHFVLAPNPGSAAFVSMHLVIGGTASDITDWVNNSNNNGLQYDNVFVPVPAGAELTDLDTDGSYAVVTPDSEDLKNFNLSHTCTGTGDTEETPPAVKVEKTAEGHWTQSYDWDVDKSLVKVEPVYTGGVLTGAAATYVVDVTGPTPVSNTYSVSGEITVTNDNDVPATITVVEDQLPGYTCVVDDDEAIGAEVVAGGDPVVMSYECTADEGTIPADDTNTASVGWSWTMEDATVAEGSTDGTADFTFPLSPDELIDEHYALEDDQYVGVVDGEEYTVAVPLTVDNCTVGFTNTVTIFGGDTGQDLGSDSVTTKVCRTIGGRTIGFWSNKNGAAAAASKPAGSTMTVLQTVLAKNYAPLAGAPFNTGKYADIQKFLTASTTNCSSDCISMLRAQFFATAMNAVHIPGYGAQTVVQPAVLAGGAACVSVATALDHISTWYPGGSTADRVAVKTFLDNLNQDNGNALQCNP